MPISCKINSKEVLSFRLTESEWIELKNNYKAQQLCMVCCDNEGIPKTSKLGTHFFAHKTREGCKYNYETFDHLRAKEIIASTAQRLGWNVKTEYEIFDSTNAQNIVDVFCEMDKKRIAFEVRMKYENYNEIKERNNIYLIHNIRPCWFMKLKKNKVYSPSDLIISNETPVFGIRYDDRNNTFIVPRFNIQLDEMIEGMLTRKLSWTPKMGSKLIAEIKIGKFSCWKCSKSISVVLGIDLFDTRKTHIDFLQFEDNKVSSLVQKYITQEISKKYRLGSIQKRFSKTVQDSYNANICYYCGALQGNFYLHEAEPIKESINSFSLVNGRDIDGIDPTWRFEGKKVDIFY